LEAGPANWLTSFASCINQGGTLAKVESQAEQDAAFALTGTTGAWFGLNDVHSEGTFEWADGTALGSFTQWNTNQPNNSGLGQHCGWIRPSTSSGPGNWDDVKCSLSKAYLCEKTI